MKFVVKKTQMKDILEFPFLLQSENSHPGLFTKYDF